MVLTLDKFSLESQYFLEEEKNNITNCVNQRCRNRGGHWPPIFGTSVNPIPTGEGRLSPPITTGTPNVFHLPASLSVLW